MKAARKPVTLKAFARILDRSPSYITELKAAGRLVLTDDGKVDVDASLALIKATADPAKDGVRARHAASREGSGAVAPPAAPERDEAPDSTPQTYPPAGDRIGSTYQASRAVRERYLAMEAKRAYEVAIGKLLDAGEVQTVVASATTSLRTALENLPTRLAPELAAITDEAKTRGLLAEAIANVLADLSRQFDALSRQASP
jgi:hypothetical protein